MYARAINRYPEETDLYLARGNYFLRKIGGVEQAIKDFKLSVEYAKTDSIKYLSLHNLGTAKSMIMDYQGAYDDLYQAYLFDSTNLDVLLNIGAVCDEAGRGDETLIFLNKALAIDSTYYPIYGNIGFKYQEMGDHETAIKYFNKLLAMSPNEPLGFSNRSFNRMKLGDLTGAQLLREGWRERHDGHAQHSEE